MADKQKQVEKEPKGTPEAEQTVARIVAYWLRVRRDEVSKGEPLTGTPNGIAQEILAALSSAQEGGEADVIAALKNAIELALPAMEPGPKSSEFGHVKEDCALVHVDHFEGLSMVSSGLLDALAKVTGETAAEIHARRVPTQPCDCAGCIGVEAAQKARDAYAATLPPPATLSDVQEGQGEGRLREALEVAVLGGYEERAMPEDLTADDYERRGLVETGRDISDEGYCRLSNAGIDFIRQALEDAALQSKGGEG